MSCQSHVKLLKGDVKTYLINTNHVLFSGGKLSVATSTGYFGPGGRHNARRKSDCGDRSTTGRGDGALPDIIAFQQVVITSEQGCDYEHVSPELFFSYYLSNKRSAATAHSTAPKTPTRTQLRRTRSRVGMVWDPTSSCRDLTVGNE